MFLCFDVSELLLFRDDIRSGETKVKQQLSLGTQRL